MMSGSCDDFEEWKNIFSWLRNRISQHFSPVLSPKFVINVLQPLD